MAKFHVQGHRKLYIHNTLDQGADNAKSDIEKKLAAGNHEGIGITGITVTPISRPLVKMQSNFFGSASCQRL